MCKWWDEEKNVWSEDGCSWVNGACECTHLTLFAAFLLFYECSTMSIVSQFPGFGAMFGEEFVLVSLIPFILALAVLAFFAIAVKLDASHEYFSHLSTVFFVDTPRPEKVPLGAKVPAYFSDSKLERISSNF